MRRLLYILLLVMGAGLLSSAVGAKKSRAASTDVVDTVLYNYIYMEGEKQRLLGNYDAAFALISEALRINPSASAPKHTLSELYLKLNNIKKSVTLQQEAADEDTTSYWYNVMYAKSLIYLERFDEAETILKRVIRNHPNRPDVYNMLATVYAYMSEYDKALACYDSIETYMGVSPEVLSYRISIYDLKGDTATAIAMAENLVEKKPTDVYYALYLSEVYSHYGCDSLRLQLLNRMASFAPEEPLLYVEYANYYLLQGDTTKYHQQYDRLFANENIEYSTKHELLYDYVAEIAPFASESTITEVYSRLIELYPYEAVLRRDYVLVLSFYDKKDEAFEQQYILAQQTGDYKDWEQLMFMSHEMGKYDVVIEAGKKAIEGGHLTRTTYIFISGALAAEKQYDESELYITKGLELCGKDHFKEKSFFYGLLGSIYSMQGVFDKCYQYYDSALLYVPEDAMLLNDYAYHIAEHGGDLLKAEQMSAKALELSPDNPTYIDTYAWIMFKMEAYFIARVYMEQAISKLSPDDSEVATYYEHYGDILAMSGDTDAAVEQWKKARENGGDSEILNKKIELKQYIENETNIIDNNDISIGDNNGL